MTREEQLKEINEAVLAGQNALEALNEAEKNLSTARTAGIWDMLGGGLISGMLKHSKMDKAQECVDRAQQALQRFQRELSDVNMIFDYGVKFDGVTKAIDLLFDNFFVDAMIQSKIKEAQENISKTKQQVQKALYKLQQMKEML